MLVCLHFRYSGWTYGVFGPAGPRQPVAWSAFALGLLKPATPKANGNGIDHVDAGVSLSYLITRVLSVLSACMFVRVRRKEDGGILIR